MDDVKVELQAGIEEKSSLPVPVVQQEDAAYEKLKAHAEKSEQTAGEFDTHASSHRQNLAQKSFVHSGKQKGTVRRLFLSNSKTVEQLFSLDNVLTSRQTSFPIDGKAHGAGGKAPGAGGKAPGAGGKAPGAGGKAPGAGGKATGAGGKAPGAGGKAPGADRMASDAGSSSSALVASAGPVCHGNTDEFSLGAQEDLVMNEQERFFVTPRFGMTKAGSNQPCIDKLTSQALPGAFASSGAYLPGITEELLDGGVSYCSRDMDGCEHEVPRDCPVMAVSEPQDDSSRIETEADFKPIAENAMDVMSTGQANLKTKTIKARAKAKSKSALGPKLVQHRNPTALGSEQLPILMTNIILKQESGEKDIPSSEPSFPTSKSGGGDAQHRVEPCSCFLIEPPKDECHRSPNRLTGSAGACPFSRGEGHHTHRTKSRFYHASSCVEVFSAKGSEIISSGLCESEFFNQNSTPPVSPSGEQLPTTGTLTGSFQENTVKSRVKDSGESTLSTLCLPIILTQRYSGLMRRSRTIHFLRSRKKNLQRSQTQPHSEPSPVAEPPAHSSKLTPQSSQDPHSKFIFAQTPQPTTKFCSVCFLPQN
eukprot:GHVR01152123.1.p1 GENE.GHVR01152123.1~~GHVR01152123.1.p1  ORF type:complete len:670 (+),score=100.95 GHVR01152123.1:240-2012(+)